MTALPGRRVLILIRGNGSTWRWTLAGVKIGPGDPWHRVHFSDFEEWLVGDHGLLAESDDHCDCASYARDPEEDS